MHGSGTGVFRDCRVVVVPRRVVDEDLRRRGWIGNDDHEAVERAKPTVIAAIESGRFPFDGSLLEWQWPADLPVGVLPDAWDRR